MADTAISALTAATSVADADFIPIVQGGTNKKAAASLIRGLALIQIVTTSGSQSSVTLTPPSSGYSDLLITANARSAKAAASDYLVVQFNADTGSNYTSNEIYANGSGGVGGTGLGAEAFIRVGEVIADSATASFFSPVICEIPGYSATTFRKSTLSRSSQIGQLGYYNANENLASGVWDSNSAITSIVLNYTADNHKDGSIFRLYARP
jgi:hypothetical protein